MFQISKIYLDFLCLVIDDGLLLLDGVLQGLVPFQQRLAKLRRQLKIWKKTINFFRTKPLKFPN